MPITLSVDISSEIARHVADILTGFAKWSCLEKYLTDTQSNECGRVSDELKKFLISIQSAFTGDSINIVFACEEMESLNILDQFYRTGWLKQRLENLTYVILGRDVVKSIVIDEDVFTANMERCRSQLGILQGLFSSYHSISISLECLFYIFLSLYF